MVKIGFEFIGRILKKQVFQKLWDIVYRYDSYDLAVWKSLKQFRPKIVIIEINSGIPPGIEQTLI